MMIDMFMRNKKMLYILIVGIFLLGAFLRWDDMSTVSNYQGIHPSFEAIYHKGQLYTMDIPNEASVCRIHPASFDFDPDEDDKNLPNLRGELRDIQIVRDLASYELPDVASHILGMGGDAIMPYKVYEWDLEKEGLIHKYRMENWLCSMEVNLWAEPSSGDFWTWFWAKGEIHEQKYSSTEIWLRLEARPDWYFEGAEQTYFGLGYMELALLTYLEGHENPDIEIIPESRWAAFSIYDSLNGYEESIDSPISQAQSYKGTLLNPEVFRDEWYTLITVDNFGTFDCNFWDGTYNTDSVQLKILVHVFVVGEWIVQPPDEQDMEEHESSEEEGWFTSFTNWVENLTNNPLAIGGGIIAIVAFALFWVFGPPKWLFRKKGGES